jgi:hypothetical protein
MTTNLYGTGTAPKTELLINNVWTDISSYVRADGKIVLRRGRANEQSRTTAQTAAFQLNNRDSRFSNRNPLSPYYGLLPLNTQLRISAGADSSGNYLRTDFTDSFSFAGAVTADKASLDLAGSIEIRVDVQPYSWRASGMFISKYLVTGNQRSWAFYMDNSGYLTFVWSPDGTAASRLFSTSTVPIPSSSGRLSIKVAFKPDNGAGSNTTAFATAASIGGTYTQLGTTITKAGVTSVFSSTAQLALCGGDDFQVPINAVNGFGGRFFKSELRNGLLGPVVASFDPSTQTIGTTTWSDGLAAPNTWTLRGTKSAVTSDRTRFYGELSSLVPTADKSGIDIYVPVNASGMIRRLTQGASPISSPMYRNFSQYSPVGYWPLEDGSTATVAGSAVNGGIPAAATAITFGAAPSGLLPGTSTVAQFQDTTSRLQFTVKRPVSTGIVSGVFYVRLSALPAAGTKTLFTFYTSGTCRTITVALSSAAWITTLLDGDGNTLATSNVLVTGIDPSKGWIGYNLLLQTSGANVNYSIRWDHVGSTGVGVGPTSLGTATIGVPTGGYTNSVADAAFLDAQISQVFMATTNFDLTDSNFANASNAWLNETAGARLVRLATENGVSLRVIGYAASTELMGYQLLDTFMNNVYDCADTDGGVLGEARDELSILYRTRQSLEARQDAVLSYASSHFSDVLQPVDDDGGFTNDVTVSRDGGSSARVIITDGPTSISPPPAGVGPYQTAVTRNATDTRLPSVAGWMALAGSWDAARFPNIPIGMHRTEITGDDTTFAALVALEFGDTILLGHMPVWLGPDDVPVLVEGYTETFGKFTWDLVYNCITAGPYQAVPVIGSDAYPVRLDATTNTIGASMTTTATSVTFVTPAGSSRWADSTGYAAEFPFNVKIAGEVMTVTAVSGTSSPQTATVTRSVNGVVKAHSSGELVRLASPFYVGR